MKKLLIFLLFTGCAHNIPDHEYVVEMPAMQFVITDKHLPDAIFGMAHREWKDGSWRYTIFIRGNQTDDGIDFPRYVAGHEMAHILNWISDDIQNPHDDLLYKVFRGWWE